MAKKRDGTNKADAFLLFYLEKYSFMRLVKLGGGRVGTPQSNYYIDRLNPATGYVSITKD